VARRYPQLHLRLPLTPLFPVDQDRCPWYYYHRHPPRVHLSDVCTRVARVIFFLIQLSTACSSAAQRATPSKQPIYSHKEIQPGHNLSYPHNLSFFSSSSSSCRRCAAILSLSIPHRIWDITSYMDTCSSGRQKHHERQRTREGKGVFRASQKGGGKTWG